MGLITFDEYPQGTAITTQYSSKGAIFDFTVYNYPDVSHGLGSGNLCLFPQESVGPGVDIFQIWFSIVDSATGSPRTTNRVEFDIAGIDLLFTTVSAYSEFSTNPSTLVYQQTIPVGKSRIVIADVPIYRVKITQTGGPPGDIYSINNLYIEDEVIPVPAAPPAKAGRVGRGLGLGDMHGRQVYFPAGR